MVRIAICEDEKDFADEMKRMVKEYFKKAHIAVWIDVFYSGEEFVRLQMGMTTYHVVFLDINMGKLNGIKTARELRRLNKTAFVIFVTANDSYVMEGYKVEALRYILKSDVGLWESVYEALDTACRRMDSLAELVEIPFCSGVKRVSKDKIVYIESDLHKVMFYILEDKIRRYYIYGSLKHISDFINVKKMIRIHQSFLINMDYCQKVCYNKVLLVTGKELPVSKKYSKDVRKFFQAYNKI